MPKYIYLHKHLQNIFSIWQHIKALPSQTKSSGHGPA